jgi:hypothetical protein
VIALVRRRVDVAPAAGVDASVQATLVELGLDLIGIEAGDAERDVTHAGAARRRGRARAAAPASAAAATDDDVADVADLALVLAAFVGAGFPAEERGVERRRFLVVRDLERNVIEPDGFPVGRFERCGRRRLSAGRALTTILTAAVADLEIEAVRILDVEALEVAVVVGDRREPALAQLRIDLFRVPRLDAPAETVEHRVARRARPAAAPATATRGRVRVGAVGIRGSGFGIRRRRGRGDVAAAQNQAAPIADVEHRLLAVVAPNLPVHERGVVGGLFRIVRDLARQMIEEHGLPASRLEGKFRRRGIAFGQARARAAALALSERRRGPNRDGEAEQRQ